MSRDIMDRVLNEGLDAAIGFLEGAGEFFPFGVTLGADGEIRHVNVWDGEERPDADDVIRRLRPALRESALAGGIVGAAIVSNVRLEDTRAGSVSDAIRLQIEARAGESLVCFLPYSLSGPAIETGELVAQRGVADLFA